MNREFPSIEIVGDRVEAKYCVAKGTGLAKFFAFFLAIIGLLVGAGITYGVLLVLYLISPLWLHYIRKKAMATIHGSGVLVSEYQFPEIYNCMITFKERLGITKDVSVYIVEDNVINAFAVKFGKKNIILLTDDLVNDCLSSGCPEALSFVIAHELGHIALNHTGVFHSWLAQYFKKLGRLNEYSADAVATWLVNDKLIAYSGLMVLTVGGRLLQYVDFGAISNQVQEVVDNKYSKKAEKTLSHPLLLNRVERVLNIQ